MINLVFGVWEGRYGWRVEWNEGSKLKTKDFPQVDLKPGIAKADAEAFRSELLNRAA